MNFVGLASAPYGSPCTAEKKVLLGSPSLQRLRWGRGLASLGEPSMSSWNAEIFPASGWGLEC